MVEPAAWEDLVRRADFDRYLATLFAPRGSRSELHVLYAFNHEVAKIAETVSQPIAGQIRLQWWRDRIAELYRGSTINHALALALGHVIAAHDLPRHLFDELIDAREHDLEEAPFATLDDLETYADATSANVMRLAARILGAGDSLDADSRELGIAYALAGLCRVLPYHAASRRLMLPADVLAATGLSVEDVFAGKNAEALRRAVDEIASRARFRLDAARGHVIARSCLPALLPAAPVPLYLRVLTKPGFDAFRDSTEVAVPRRQLAMLGAVIRRQI